MSDIQGLALAVTILAVTVFIHGVQIEIHRQKIRRLEGKK